MNEEANRKFQKELNSGAISLVLMALIADSGQAMYGYEIAKRLPSFPDGELPMNESAIYPVLRSLERQGLLASQMKPSDSGPPRKYYRLTPSGGRTLVKWRVAWSQTKDFVDQVLEQKNDDTTSHAGSKLPRTI
jgi:PadR family transcriptional regulator, regulatory protein PadR